MYKLLSMLFLTTNIMIQSMDYTTWSNYDLQTTLAIYKSIDPEYSLGIPQRDEIRYEQFRRLQTQEQQERYTLTQKELKSNAIILIDETLTRFSQKNPSPSSFSMAQVTRSHEEISPITSTHREKSTLNLSLSKSTSPLQEQSYSPTPSPTIQSSNKALTIKSFGWSPIHTAAAFNTPQTLEKILTEAEQNKQLHIVLYSTTSKNKVAKKQYSDTAFDIARFKNNQEALAILHKFEAKLPVESRRYQV